jgi:hypothetical protein
MTTYRVTVSAHGYYEADIEANSPEEAIHKAKSDDTVDWDINMDGSISGDDYEAEELVS